MVVLAQLRLVLYVKVTGTKLVHTVSELTVVAVFTEASVQVRATDLSLVRALITTHRMKQLDREQSGKLDVLGN